jgi:hypothetical protein
VGLLRPPQLAPQDSTVQLDLASLQAARGRFDQAITLQKRAVGLRFSTGLLPPRHARGVRPPYA